MCLGSIIVCLIRHAGRSLGVDGELLFAVHDAELALRTLGKGQKSVSQK